MSMTRRSAMTTLAAAAVPAAALPALAAGADPIYAAIERHKVLWADECAIVGEQFRLEDEIPSERRVAYHVGDRGTDVGANDDPRWTAHQARYWAACDAADAAAWGLLDQPPVTPGGVAALLMYAYDFEDEGYQWPDGRDDGTGLDWRDQLPRSAARANGNVGRLTDRKLGDLSYGAANLPVCDPRADLERTSQWTR